MKKSIFFYNVIYYIFILLLIMKGREDPSSSLGYGYFIIGFWIFAVIVLFFLLNQKIIQIKSTLDKIGIFTATPILSILIVILVLFFNEKVGSERYFVKDNYRYKVKTFIYKKSLSIKRIEYYRCNTKFYSNTVTNKWLRDSTWVYLSKSGDTINQVKYRNDKEVK